jgi:hypothetical protein
VQDADAAQDNQIKSGATPKRQGNPLSSMPQAYLSNGLAGDAYRIRLPEAMRDTEMQPTSRNLPSLRFK